MMLRPRAVVLAGLLPVLTALAATIQTPPDNKGKEFVLMFMKNLVYDKKLQPELYVTTQENKDVHVTVTTPKWNNPKVDAHFVIKAGEVHKIIFPDNFRMSGDKIETKSVHVTADAEVVCYGANREGLSNDVYLGLPTDGIGTEYYAVTHSKNLNDSKSEIGIAAVTDGTVVDVTLPSTPGVTVTYNKRTYKSGDTIPSIKMDRFETLQLQSRGDLTGTHIVASHPVTVLSGNEKTNIGKGISADHLVEQMTSVDRWGKLFVTAPIPHRTTGDVFRIVASEPNTQVRVGSMVYTLRKAGDSKEIIIPSDRYGFINSTKPVLVTQFVQSQQTPNEPADPSMMILPPYELFGSDYTFTTPQYSRPDFATLFPQNPASDYKYENLFMVVADEKEKDGLLLDGKPFPKTMVWTKIRGTNLVGSFIPVGNGTHRVRHVNPLSTFGGYLYGHAYHESYAFPTGMRLAKINVPCVKTKQIPGDGVDNDCDGKIDEELCNSIDDDNDNKIDEDCIKPSPVDGLWSTWGSWGSCSVTCNDGVSTRHRNCSSPAPKFGGKNCTGTDTDTRPCYAGQQCPIDVKSACQKNPKALIPHPNNCGQYYNCSQKTSPLGSLGSPYLHECHYPDLFSSASGKCEKFENVTCGRRKEPMAPCEYKQNLCKSSTPGCIPCPQRLPSCVGVADGKNTFHTKFDGSPEYKQCYKNRTIHIDKCKTGFFNPFTKQCVPYNFGSLFAYCSTHPKATLPEPNNCAKFYNCAKQGRTPAQRTDECKYPDLYDSNMGTCSNFTTVTCDNRMEPQAPCQYDQYKCSPSNKTCTPCPNRHGDCRGLPDGHEYFTTKKWTANYVTCYLNRTMKQETCTRGYFHPIKKRCMTDVNKKDLPDVCKANPHAVFRDPNNCAQYFNCSVGMTKYGNHIQECDYPDLFDDVTLTCRNFTSVKCGKRNEPQAPCDYAQNLCNTTHTGGPCAPCPRRLPSCVGQPDGAQPFPGRTWKPNHIVCYLNRTVDITNCTAGYFHPRQKKCLDDLARPDANEYCKANPNDVVPTPDNCAQFYNCSVTGVKGHVIECRYPDLFSTVTKKCDNFTGVDCKKRKEPQAPCEYDQNHCNTTTGRTCVPCPDRLPTCVGKPDGSHAFPNKLWKPVYIVCYKNRTMGVKNCSTGYFHPRQKKCLDDLARPDANEYCKANPKGVLPTPDNCAQFYDCSVTGRKDHVIECMYPDLFSTISMTCENFTGVDCKKRKEPQAPCEYDQNHCKTNTSCIPCKKRLPSCVGLPDEDQPVPGALWTENYVHCYKNRTISVQKCPQGSLFDPKKLRCVSNIPTGSIDAFCKANPKAVKAHPTNCAQYYNCSNNNSPYGHHLQECKYPDLFSSITRRCENFTSVTCGNLTEPEPPCDYIQNHCNGNVSGCRPCVKRLPSCVGLADGPNQNRIHPWTADYVDCYLNRTMDMKKCRKGYFHPVKKTCTDKVDKVDVPNFCMANPHAIVPSEDNCAHFYNCSERNTKLQNYMKECKYPDLYSRTSGTCENFTSVSCDTRKEPEAPCEYDQNKCNGSLSCVPCPKRLPSCVGTPDGDNGDPNHLWKPNYIHCYLNRTLDMKKCKRGYFHPKMKICTEKVDKVDVPDYCAANPNAIVPSEDNCAHFYNCSEKNSKLGNYMKECKYPDLFDRTSGTCENFTSVSCDTRKEPQAPCEYNQNLCKQNSTSCLPCPKRLPSCVGLPNEDQAVLGALWTDKYVHCYNNRTISVQKCPQGQVFDPNRLQCVANVPKGAIDAFCLANPRAVKAHPTNCAQYYNCSDNSSPYGHHLQECKYPDLFSSATGKCENFTSVSCGNLTEPEPPCGYLQNQCNGTTSACLPCIKRLPSCVGLPDGINQNRIHMWTADYVDCYLNRTMAMKKCRKGYFHPVKKVCTEKVNKVDVPDYCTANPHAIVPSEDNCAHFYNCSDKNTKLGNSMKECRYPDLFSRTTATCENFTSVPCDTRKEPQAPCEYDQNICNGSSPCVPCPKRLPSCVGTPDGDNGDPNHLWKPDYIHCYLNRTLDMKKCKRGYFHPKRRMCTETVDPVDVPDYCMANPNAIVPSEDNCAHFYNCSDKNAKLGNYMKECKYPDLFSRISGTCENFTSVSCDKRKEPQAPCEYSQNLCNHTTLQPCPACPKRLPSCIGLSDGNHIFPGRSWKPDFIVCYKNRTMDIKKCTVGYFHPRDEICKQDLARPDAKEYCQANPNDVLPTPDNCAQFYNCSSSGAKNHVLECKYPDLFSPVTMGCELFPTVDCKKRKEPQAPCEYDQNLCKQNGSTCVPCPDRLPSCVGLPDGDQPVAGALWTDKHVRCFRNRTLSVDKCPTGSVFDPHHLRCVAKIKTGDIDEFCKANPRAIKAHPTNCAQYFNCSEKQSPYGHYLHECTYPDLFSSVTKRCENFTSVKCGNLSEPEPPCAYLQNHCNGSVSPCLPCPSRLPTCVGQPDGANPSNIHMWTADYVECYLNRTMEMKKCKKGYFHPTKKICTEKVDKVDIPYYCAANPSAIVPSPDDCAQYYNCSVRVSTLGNHKMECNYPDLFSTASGMCEQFENVTCNRRPEPQEPCAYERTKAKVQRTRREILPMIKCNASDPTCIPCPERFPSCLGKPDGKQPFDSRMWKPDYVVCYKNRTVQITKCQHGYFHPRSLLCTQDVKKVDAKEYCKANLNDIVPVKDDCAQFYNCSNPLDPVQECKYPDLFVVQTQTCDDFTTVKCKNRSEPQAPCDYTQNLCNPGDVGCKPCPERLPSCVGLSDGTHAFPTRLWKKDFIVCFKNRTIKIDKCKTLYFHPMQGKCTDDVARVDAKEYCKANLNDIVPVTDDCAQYFNCSVPLDPVQECKYPDLFDVKTQTCEDFTTVKCKRRPEPQAPCEYIQNVCSNTSTNCSPCPERWSTCVGRPDGARSFIGKKWTEYYVHCFKNRTMSVDKCPNGAIFEPNKRMCVSNIPPGDIDKFCKYHPHAMKPHPSNCAQYFNCSDLSSKYGNHLEECQYPDLYSSLMNKCDKFTNVKCDKPLYEPQAPCEYLQNLCNQSDPTCKPCPDRLPSCIGLPDGNNAYPNSYWKPVHVTCFMNRTLDVKKCSKGYFHPVKKICTEDIKKVDVKEYCKANPNDIFDVPDNCAHYVNCSREKTALGNYLHECSYPDLFSATTKQCENFTSMHCKTRKEPQAPCEYNLNLYPLMDHSCEPCPKRLPSCVGMPDGYNPIPTELWQQRYVKCYKNRTIELLKCSSGYFHPGEKVCKVAVKPVDVPQYCVAHPNDVLPNPGNCAKYFNCSSGIHGLEQECKYPDLFSTLTGRCEYFTSVKCDKRPEPQAPCDYMQNQCSPTDSKCLPCPNRLPSCVGRADGLQSFPGRLWRQDYIRCYKNRTLDVTKCTTKYFHPRDKTCTDDVLPPDVKDFCTAHPTAVLPATDNCAQYVNCSDNNSPLGNNRVECHYPDLFSTDTLSCTAFINVDCKKRPEPQAPCQYQQNICKPNDATCAPCPERLPSCIGLVLGKHVFPGKEWTSTYISCFLNRTMKIDNCPAGSVLNPQKLDCVTNITQTNIVPFCRSNPREIREHPSNCALFFNCSDLNSGLGSYLHECPYPMLFSAQRRICADFHSVPCANKQEPQAPCQYFQNLCPAQNTTCLPCSQRLQSCVGLPNGPQPISTRKWKPEYVTCDNNRTISVKHCPLGSYFHPNIKICRNFVDPVDVPEYCPANPNDVIPDRSNCGQYYNCSKKMASLGSYHEECRYPDLFDTTTLLCHNFTDVTCMSRPEPQAPCEYEQNICQGSVTSCKPCPSRLPSCVGMSDGVHAFQGRKWKADYITCFRNRTINIGQCKDGYFHPHDEKCESVVKPVDVKEYCAENTMSVLPRADNCAHFYNCSIPFVDGNRHQECTYPDLFSTASGRCEPFISVECHSRPEPQAPCDYMQNICDVNNVTCIPCYDRLPDCIGLPNGDQPDMRHRWSRRYVRCFENRTMHVYDCPRGYYFHPTKKQCTAKLTKDDSYDFCKAHPGSLRPHPTNCAQYYNCSASPGQGPDRGHIHLLECKYPQLFSRTLLSCGRFTDVSCDLRHEPKSPCEYLQNACDARDPNCKPCPDRIPSCVGLPDGANPAPRKIWKDGYIICLHNRTMIETKCATGVFNPKTSTCVTIIDPPDIPDFCQANPRAVVPDPRDCSRFFNCSSQKHALQCVYPALFDTNTLTCVQFEMENCSSRYEPMNPCEYDSNLCSKSSLNCKPCPERLPSCIGLPDGDNGIQGRLWGVEYATCHKNRTMSLQHCRKGVFDPSKRACSEEIDPKTIFSRCSATPHAVLAHPYNCAQFFNCSNPATRYGNYLQECTYPALFSPKAGSCQNFTSVACTPKFEPQAPCEYEQKRCALSNTTCVPCVVREQSCVGLPDGANPIYLKRWSPEYVVCYLNRTIEYDKCPPDEYFNPFKRACVRIIQPVEVIDFCASNPNTTLPHPYDCAKYFVCSDPRREFAKECPYPQLYSKAAKTCKQFTDVRCESRKEPQAPCEYQQNLCMSGDSTCTPCRERHSSCVGLQDGVQPFIGLEWTRLYVYCYKNRTIRMSNCTDGLFDPRTRRCSTNIDKSIINEVCTANPNAIFSNPDNCAQYFTCPSARSMTSSFLKECKYPDLFSTTTLDCKTFEMVHCHQRSEPMAPCQYEQNQCKSVQNCRPCPERLPSCIGLPDGVNSVAGLLWSANYITCYKNRTTSVDTCAKGWFNPRAKRCEEHVVKVDITDFCKWNPSAVVPNMQNAAQYFDCSTPSTQVGYQHLKECFYPDLFSIEKQKCVRFETVDTKERPEPQAPCDYLTNHCQTGDVGCEPCEHRLYSCVGLPNGNNGIQGKQWKPNYITCYRNRTLAVHKCPKGDFDPLKKLCTEKIDTSKSTDNCDTNPNNVYKHPGSCALYYNCSATVAQFGSYLPAKLQECQYPRLFSPLIKACADFELVDCDTRHEVQAPCEYLNNQCSPDDKHCLPCPTRLPSCKGLPDGVNAIIGRMWSRDYANCYKNRTISVSTCYNGYFHPVQKRCRSDVDRVDIFEYCKSTPAAIVPDPLNCAHYYNCSLISVVTMTTGADSLKEECRYPGLFSTATKRCEDFTTVLCGNRPEPKAPCDYRQNQCPPSNVFSAQQCEPCSQRLPSCVGLLDGDNAISGTDFSKNYITCYRNRTVNYKKCAKGFFDRVSRTCVEKVTPVNIQAFCQQNRGLILPHPNNCAWYYNCSNIAPTARSTYPHNPTYVMECPYPQLFSTASMTCSEFTTVACGSRYEPQAPCNYIKNECEPRATVCVPCIQTHPSCVGLLDGKNTYSKTNRRDLYVNCYRNRTLSIDSCMPGYFDPNRRECVIYIKTMSTTKKPSSSTIKSTPTSTIFSIGTTPTTMRQTTETSTTTEVTTAPTSTTEKKSSSSWILPPSYQPPVVVSPWQPQTVKPVVTPWRPQTLRTPKPWWVLPPSYQPPVVLPSWQPPQTVKPPVMTPWRPQTLQTPKPWWVLPPSYQPPLVVSPWQPVTGKPYTMTTKVVSQTESPASTSSMPGGVCFGREGTVFASDAHCGQYYNCTSLQGPYLYECPYPHMFSDVTNSCQQFTTVSCGSRPEFVAPCDYQQNICPWNDKACIPCPQRWPTCQRLADGNYPVPSDPSESFYFVCQQHRTVSIGKCKDGVFDSSRKECVLTPVQTPKPSQPPVSLSPWKPVTVVPVTTEKPAFGGLCAGKEGTIFSNSLHCGQYYNCTSSVGPFLFECPYPQMFSDVTHMCQAFTSVTCINRKEYKAPCDYQQNHCTRGDKTCIRCSQKWPSCVGLPDGRYHIATDVTVFYQCYQERTMSMGRCEDGIFSHKLQQCVATVTVPSTTARITPAPTYRPHVTLSPWIPNIVPVSAYTGICSKRSGQVFANPLHCGQFYKCSGQEEPFIFECEYPSLFSETSLACHAFTDVTCGSRPVFVYPCDYQQHQCLPENNTCISCAKRWPSCVGLSDGRHAYQDKGSGYYFECYMQRTMGIQECPAGTVYEPTSRTCVIGPPTDAPATVMVTVPYVSMATWKPVVVPLPTVKPVQGGICANRAGEIFSNPLHCGQYYNCTDPVRPFVYECPYPQLFSDVSMKCQNFTTVRCQHKPEYMAPCEYQQNICPPSAVDCAPCPQRLPSCIGRKDGDHAFPGQLWHSKYIRCYRNRTMLVGQCPGGVFDPDKGKCSDAIDHSNIAFYCKSHPDARIPHPANCAQYYDCTDVYTFKGNYFRECPYPQLFDPVNKECADFTTVQCKSRYEPQAPCEYMQNKCTDPGCVPCSDRYVSCIGKPDGNNVFIGQELTDKFVTCYRNRTMSAGTCSTGEVFDPATRRCGSISTGSINTFCSTNPDLVRPHPIGCAQYIDCGVNALSISAIRECEYPKSFSPLTLKCQDFQTVQCGPRHEQKAPCEYLQNLCNGSDPNCVPCIDRLPSCIGLPDGDNVVVGRKWQSKYVTCFKERTVTVKECREGMFDPYKRKCSLADMSTRCRQDPSLVFGSSENCAQYYTCSKQHTVLGNYLEECPYPQLFDDTKKMCVNFTNVKCNKKVEPKAFCDYQRNECHGAHCKPCVDTIPSCIDKPDGRNAPQARKLSPEYIMCLQERTVYVGQCEKGMFDPVARKCTERLSPELIQAFCSIYPGALVPYFRSCAQYYHCSHVPKSVPNYSIEECQYPDLFSVSEGKCKPFTEVSCGQRSEPQAPCEYVNKQCRLGDAICTPCTQREHNCVGRADGNHAVSSVRVSPEYYICRSNRTVGYSACLPGYFDPQTRKCNQCFQSTK